ncbi:MAG: hypothetical protein UR83_C0071G0003 [Candidatus Moranbacteria bacterium GW2011_GWF2_35_54]|nr:MAG: hypothetical protein UR83_C0071G0003 [Candidatus Moranbacteria bacterium GW2011_GWF2_35_54]
MSMEEFQKIKDLSAVEKNNLIGKRITAKLRSNASDLTKRA